MDVLRWGSDGAAEAAFGDFLLRRGEDEGQDAGGMPRLAGHRAEWWRAISAGLRHRTYLLVLRDRDDVLGVLPLMLVKGPLFGKFLVSLPYLNTGGVWGGGSVCGVDEGRTACAVPLGGGGGGGVGAGLLVDRACALADELDVRYLELRHEVPVEGHPKLNFSRTDKVHMRLALPASDEALDKSFKSKLRSQVRKAGQSELTVVWGGEELLSDFYSVFAVNMRDLGTPVFSRRLFAATLKEFAGSAELCVVRKDGQAVAGALLVHCDGVTEVPSASCLRAFNYTGANMWMYRHLLARAIEKQSHTFDFGRSSVGSGTYKFKAQWGAEPFPAVWQYYIRKGSADAMRPDSDGNQKLIKIWQRLPVWVTKLMGPEIVRGIP
ncbi:GNAT family N-acetyltransferase [Roseimaritima multifibrata]|uniref:GNAT family N-acetyltransferase n=1 Tax=Roseimaritima multifibrata TaxID=1930274 RepID=UPI001FE2CD10|nr:GNAT family N-acetyltransferase [Roseimaritima multifibrata]